MHAACMQQLFLHYPYLALLHALSFFWHSISFCTLFFFCTRFFFCTSYFFALDFILHSLFFCTHFFVHAKHLCTACATFLKLLKCVYLLKIQAKAQSSTFKQKRNRQLSSTERLPQLQKNFFFFFVKFVFFLASPLDFPFL